MTITTHRLQFPLTKADALQLRAGDQVIIDGEIVVTAGLPTHQRLVAACDGAEPLPFDLREQSLFHIGSMSEEANGEFLVRYINPTTSTRFNSYMPGLIRGLGLRAVGGKGGLDQTCVEALRSVGGVYLSFLGGGCTLLSSAIRQVVEVGWPDMLTHYRLVKLKVEGLGPVTVGIDAHGNSCFEDVKQHAKQNFDSILAQLASEREGAVKS